MGSHVSAESVIRYLQLNIFSKHTAKFIMKKHFLVKSVVDISQGRVTLQSMPEYIQARNRMYVKNVAKLFQFKII
jgi:hypothetical protein